MSNTYKTGDKLIVLNHSVNIAERGIRDLIGKTVTVADSDFSFVKIVELPNGPAAHGWWATERFELAPKREVQVGDIVTYDPDAKRNRYSSGYDSLRGIRCRVKSTYLAGGDQFISIDYGSHGGMYADRFKVLNEVNPWYLPTPKPPVAAPAPAATWVIMLRENGKLAPSTAPREFVSEAQAIKVAKKMAEENTGEFVVFKSISAAIVPAVVKPTAVVSTFA